MIGPEIVRTMREQLGDLPGQVVSLFLDVNPANPDNVRNAPFRKAREAMRDLPLPDGLAEQIVQRLEQQHPIAEGRTLIVFAGADAADEVFHVHHLQARLPLLEATDGVLAHWGKPFIAPLLFLLDQKERYGALYVSGRRVRCFEAFLGEFEERFDLVRETDKSDWTPYREARRSPAVTGSVAARGGADTDRYDDRVEAATQSFYRGTLPPFQEFVAEENVDRIILIGLDEAVSAFESILPTALAEKVIGRLPPPADPSASAPAFQPLVREVIERAEREHEEELLEQIRERGVWGRSETLTLLQNHRLSVLVVPWKMDGTVYLAEPSGRVAFSSAELDVLQPDQSQRTLPLLEVLPSLVDSTGTKLEFVTDEREELLLSEFGGLAGVKRW